MSTTDGKARWRDPALGEPCELDLPKGRPPMFNYLKLAAAVPGAMKLLMAPMRLGAPRRLPFAFGWLVKRPIDRRAEDSYVLAGMAVPGVERDVKRMLRSLDKRLTNEAADKLGGFSKPALIAWSREDRLSSPPTPSAWPRICPTPGSSGSTTPVRLPPRTSPSGSPS